jgi:hypothetical protein
VESSDCFTDEFVLGLRAVGTTRPSEVEDESRVDLPVVPRQVTRNKTPDVLRKREIELRRALAGSSLKIMI